MRILISGSHGVDVNNGGGDCDCNYGVIDNCRGGDVCVGVDGGGVDGDFVVAINATDCKSYANNVVCIDVYCRVVMFAAVVDAMYNLMSISWCEALSSVVRLGWPFW